MRASICRQICLLISALLAAALAGCGGGGGSSELQPVPINHPPTVSIISPASNPYILDVTKSQTLDITLKAEDPDGGKLKCVWTWDAGSVSPDEYEIDAGTETTAQFTPPKFDGRCKLTVSISDGEASASKDIVINVTGWNVQPGTQLRILSISMTPDPVAPSGTASVSATVDNPGGKTLSYTWKSKYGTFSGTGATVAWTAPRTPGVYGIYLAVSDGTTSAAAGKAVMVAGPTGGLLGQYFTTYRDRNLVRFENMVMSRTDPTVNFHWEKLSPAPGTLPGDGFGAKWTGLVKCEQPGAYTFRVHVDDGARMRVQDDTGNWIYVIPNNTQNWRDHTEGAWLPDPVIPLQLQGGKWYPLELEYFEGGGDAFIDLYWSINGSPETIVPQESLKPPS